MTIHLVRHGTAGQRTALASDIERPLDESGAQQAERIAEHLAGCRAETVLSSPAMRCRETITPLAKSLGLRVGLNQDLWEEEDPRKTLALVRRLAQGGSDAVLCSHGAVIPKVVEQLANEDVELVGNGCDKGSIWSLTVTDGAITSARYHAP